MTQIPLKKRPGASLDCHCRREEDGEEEDGEEAEDAEILWRSPTRSPEIRSATIYEISRNPL
jgi:hypothetical protein